MRSGMAVPTAHAGAGGPAILSTTLHSFLWMVEVVTFSPHNHCSDLSIKLTVTQQHPNCLNVALNKFQARPQSRQNTSTHHPTIAIVRCLQADLDFVKSTPSADYDSGRISFAKPRRRQPSAQNRGEGRIALREDRRPRQAPEPLLTCTGPVRASSSKSSALKACKSLKRRTPARSAGDFQCCRRLLSRAPQG